MNYKSDFTRKEILKDGYLDLPFIFRYFTVRSSFTASFDGHKYDNCYRNEDGSITVVFDSHGLNPGHLHCRRQYFLSDSRYNDGVCNVESVEAIDFWLTNAETSGTDSEGNILPFYTKGDSGDSAYEEWIKAGNVGTEDDFISWIQKPSLDAAQAATKAKEEANTATTKANEATKNANNATDKSVDDTSKAITKMQIDADNILSSAKKSIEDDIAKNDKKVETAVLNAENATENADNAAKEAGSAAEEANKAKESVEANEEKRETEEKTRNKNEQARVDQETKRVTEEQSRKTKEQARADEETKRIAAEKKRVDEESTRATEEKKRKDSETARVEEEKKRVTEEQKRQTGYEQVDTKIAGKADFSDLTEFNVSIKCPTWGVKADGSAGGNLYTAATAVPAFERFCKENAQLGIQLDKGKIISFYDKNNIYNELIYNGGDIIVNNFIKKIDNAIFVNTPLNKYFKEFYIEGLDAEKDYCLRTLRQNDNNIQINIGDENGSVIQLITSTNSNYAYAESGNIKCYCIIQHKEEITGSLIFANTDISAAKLNKLSCEDIINSPYIYSKNNIEKSNKRIEVFETINNNPIIEMYIQGGDINKNYFLYVKNKSDGILYFNFRDESGNIVSASRYSKDDSKDIIDIPEYQDSGIGGYVLVNSDKIPQNDSDYYKYSYDNYLSLDKNPSIKERINKKEIDNSIETVKETVICPPQFNGYSLPKNPDNLKVLFVGNSFADQPISRLALWLSALGINNCTYGVVMRSGGTLEQHYNSIVNNSSYDQNSAFRLYKIINGEVTYIENCEPTVKTGEMTTSGQIKLKDCLEFTDWDVITFHQQSGNSGKWETIYPYLPTLIQAARYYCSNAGVKIGWQMTWAYAKGYNELASYNNSQDYMYNCIVNCAKKVQQNFGIDLIIPSGTIVQNLRSIPSTYWDANDLQYIRGYEAYSSDTTNADFTDDGLHPNDIAEYCTSAGFAQLIFAACYNKSIRNLNVSIPPLIGGRYAKIARQCVLKAIGNRFSVSEIDINNLE